MSTAQAVKVDAQEPMAGRERENASDEYLARYAIHPTDGADETITALVRVCGD